MEEWKTYKLEKIATIVTGKTPSTKNPDNFGGCIHFVTPGDLCNGNKHVLSTGRYLTTAGLLSIKGSILPKGAICVSCIGNLGYTGITTMQCASNQQINSIIVNQEHNTDFVYYLIKHMWPVFKSFEGQSTALSILNKSQFSKLEVTLPNRNVQDKIASILSSFDDKIELNNRINHNLEEQAQTLYKSWFVDFEPFKNGKFVESELGMIPEGWRVGHYSDIIEGILSGDWGKDAPTGNYTHKVCCVRGCDFADIKNGVRGNTPERYILEKNYEAKRLRTNDVVVEISGGTSTVSTGRICLVSEQILSKYNQNIVCTNFCKVCRPTDGYSAYLFYSWQDKYKKKLMFGYENGTSGIKNFQITDFVEKEPLIIPPVNVLTHFQHIADTIQACVQENGSSNTKCKKIRDNILPRLLSGEITC